MRKRYKIVLNVVLDEPDAPFPAGGSYTHRSRIDGLIHSLMGTWPSFEATITLDKVIDKGVIEPQEKQS